MSKNNKHWTSQQDEYLKEHYEESDLAALCEHLGKSEHSIRWRASYLGITEPPKYWTKEERTFLVENYTTLSAEQMAERLGRTVSAVRKKAALLGAARSSRKANTEAIDRNIPFFKGKTGEYLSLLSQMKVGDSFEHPGTDRQTIQNCIKNFPERLYRTKKETSSTRRIWRLL